MISLTHIDHYSKSSPKKQLGSNQVVHISPFVLKSLMFSLLLNLKVAMVHFL